MRSVSSCVRGEWFRVPLGGPSASVRSLGSEALRRYNQAKKMENGYEETEFSMRRCQHGELLHPEDRAEDVLEDSDFVRLDKGENTSDDSSTVNGNLTPEAEEKVLKARELIDSFVREDKVVYGVNTGIGKSVSVLVPKEQLLQLQKNLIRSHCAGVGAPLSIERARMLLGLRINILAKGYSGISMEILDAMIKAFNASCLSWVPEKGTVGASGDLAPLAHLALGLMGEGRMWSPQSGWADAKTVSVGGPWAHDIAHGIAMINRTQLMSSLGAEAVERAMGVARQADIIAALSLEVLKGNTKAFHRAVHALRPHPGQMDVAERLRSLLDSDVFPSQISESHRSCGHVQDPHTLRCIPQVHGVVNDTIAFVHKVISTELNSATDNPVLDYLTIEVHELASISERRVERLVNPALSDLPAFLVQDDGLNSGFMIAHCTAAALVSESKALCHPSSIDSLSTSGTTEDHVSMGGWAARKALRVVEHVEQGDEPRAHPRGDVKVRSILAIELLAACQALEFLRPLKTTSPLEKVYELVRFVVSPWDRDRIMSPDIEAAHRLVRQQEVWRAVQPYMDEYKERLQT